MSAASVLCGRHCAFVPSDAEPGFDAAGTGLMKMRTFVHHTQRSAHYSRTVVADMAWRMSIAEGVKNRALRVLVCRRTPVSPVRLS